MLHGTWTVPPQGITMTVTSSKPQAEAELRQRLPGLTRVPGSLSEANPALFFPFPTPFFLLIKYQSSCQPIEDLESPNPLSAFPNTATSLTLSFTTPYLRLVCWYSQSWGDRVTTRTCWGWFTHGRQGHGAVRMSLPL